ncbi:MAG: hypothetical protein CMP11_07215 [Zetaproteobacteria bacterium]|nr:hypothetical protein [Pseudobdellovibrionaceae bacterium]
MIIHKSPLAEIDFIRTFDWYVLNIYYYLILPFSLLYKKKINQLLLFFRAVKNIFSFLEHSKKLG